MSDTVSSPRVIVVDDEPAMRNIVRRMLEPAGYLVEEALVKPPPVNLTLCYGASPWRLRSSSRS